ncbi:MAG TPA: filamentous hemagglutinin [Cyanobacteria bacterium UBA11162]|nr:filamentous hemagglutinin [Cyanobacteria bacterium UBA11162]
MQCSVFNYWRISGSILIYLFTQKISVAQIVPDVTLPNNSSVQSNCTNCEITGGTTVDNNLFHSFEQFSIPTGGTAYFINVSTIENIISRVTGKSISNIDGLIRTNGAANLFLLNPNGIIFGRNASLDINGSFIASTASSLKFADGTEFSITDTHTKPLLTLSVPIGLQFGDSVGGIINQSRATPDGALNSVGLPVGLKVKLGQTLALVGSNVELKGGNLTAEGGRIELGSVAGNNLVSLTQTNQGWELGYEGVQTFQDISLSQTASVDASGDRSGDIQIQGRRVILTGGSQLVSLSLTQGQAGDVRMRASDSVELLGVGSFADGGFFPTGVFAEVYEEATGEGATLTIEAERLIVQGGAIVSTTTWGTGRGVDLKVSASESVELVGTSPDGAFPSGLFAQVEEGALGNGGTLTIETERLLVQDGSQISAATFGAGRAGNIRVSASQSVELVGTAPDEIIPSGLFTQVEQGATGNGGDLTIETGRLIARYGAQISSAARSGGQGGTITINASDSIFLTGTAPKADLVIGSSGIFVSAEQGATREAGELNITTGQLTVENGAKISADNFGTGEGGSATLNVNQLVVRDGGVIRAGSFSEGSGGTLTVNAAESVEIIGSGMIGSEPVKSTLFTQAEAAGNAGNLTITTRNLIVRDGAEVTVSGRSSGDAGNLTVEANSISLDNQATLSADTKAGQGNINLNSVALVLYRGSNITTNAEGSDITGGNININADVLAALENSDISANSADFRGGNVTVTAQGIFGTQFREQLTPESDITATGANSSLNGQVTINTPDVDPSQGLTELPVEPVNVEVAQGCQVGGNQSSVAFFNTGRGGLAPNPYEPISSSNIWEDVPLPTQEIANSASSARASTSPNIIVEAKGWIVNEKGEVILVAEMPTNLSQNRCSLR